MKNQIVKNEKELRVILKKSLETACRDNEDCGTVKSNAKRIASEIDHFIEYSKPKEYPVLLILDHTMHSIGMYNTPSVFLATGYQYLTKVELETHLRDITVALNEIVMKTYPKRKLPKREDDNIGNIGIKHMR